MKLQHTKERGIVRTVSDPVFGHIKIPRTPLRFSEFPDTPDLQAGTLGQYNHEILRDKLGYTDHQIAELEKLALLPLKTSNGKIRSLGKVDNFSRLIRVDRPLRQKIHQHRFARFAPELPHHTPRQL